MARARRQAWFAATPAAAEALWFDVTRWSSWVDGLARIASAGEGWPEVGSSVTWESTPYGRGRVSERVTSWHPGVEHEVAFEDDRLVGRQTISFASEHDGVEVALAQEWRLKGGLPGSVVIDWLFIRRAIADSLRRTLESFGRELEKPGENLL